MYDVAIQAVRSLYASGRTTGMESCGIHETTFNSIHECDVEHPEDLYANTVLSGGTTMLPRGIATGCRRNHGHCPQHDEDQGIIAPLSASTPCGLGLHPGLTCPLPADVDQQAGVRESGPSIVHRKCF
ncbi:actin; acrosomal process isoform [Camelus dromedarius]|uniref:Actin n=1 Tax=Camelus dromedarius TaxID=9838 RepID=A0A5N4D5V5_CAMDR|nr:actin; acrosomal process isoform [Camelus dromedarius]